MGNLAIGEIAEEPTFGTRQMQTSTNSANQGNLPKHFAISPGFDNSLREGEELRIKLDFTKGSELFHDLKPDEIASGNFFEVLSLHRGITKNLTIHVIFRSQWEEPGALAKAQSDMLLRLVKVVETFPGLKEVNVLFAMVKENWAQWKHAIFFYRLNQSVPDWSLSHMTADRPFWHTMELGSLLDMKFRGERTFLVKNGLW